jgi:ABC-type methionine transport system ATPase subunit
MQNDSRSTQVRIRIRIPKQYQQEPIISNLITQYNLTINIAAALLSANAHEDGWFDLELRGTSANIQNGLLYLNQLNMEIWHDSASGAENW